MEKERQRQPPRHRDDGGGTGGSGDAANEARQAANAIAQASAGLIASTLSANPVAFLKSNSQKSGQ